MSFSSWKCSYIIYLIVILLLFSPSGTLHIQLFSPFLIFTFFYFFSSLSVYWKTSLSLPYNPSITFKIFFLLYFYFPDLSYSLNTPFYYPFLVPWVEYLIFLRLLFMWIFFSFAPCNIFLSFELFF